MSDRPSDNLGGLDIAWPAASMRSAGGSRPTGVRGADRASRTTWPTSPKRADRRCGPSSRPWSASCGSRRRPAALPEAVPPTRSEPRASPDPATVAEAPTIAPGSLAHDTASRRRHCRPHLPTISPPRCSGRMHRPHPASPADPHPLLRRLRDRPRAGPRRHGRRLPGQAGEPQPARGAQDDPRRPARRRHRRQAASTPRPRRRPTSIIRGSCRSSRSASTRGSITSPWASSRARASRSAWPADRCRPARPPG